MTERNDGGSAFPNGFDPPMHARGMSLRDWFAGQALASLATDMSRNGSSPLTLATLAYLAADAMLKARQP
jgi:hypothetical protein